LHPVGEKRRSDAAPGGCSTAKRSSSGGLVRGGGSSVRASHLLVKHKDSRRPSSWKVRWWRGWRLGFGGRVGSVVLGVTWQVRRKMVM
jgi:hypothetical protein